MKKLLLTAAVATLTVVPIALAAGVSRFDKPVSGWHLATAPHTTFVTLRQVGVAPAASTTDDTRLISFVDGLGQQEKTHTARWKLVHLPSSVPSRAKAVRLSFRAAITRGHSNGSTVVYAFVRTPGSPCCNGPKGFENYPVDFSLQGQRLDGSDNLRPPMVVQADAVGPSGSYRGWYSVDIPIRHHSFAFAWGYRRTMGIWPQGDAVGVGIYVDAWAD